MTDLKWAPVEMVPIFLSLDLPVRSHEETQQTDWPVIGLIQDTVILSCMKNKMVKITCAKT